MESTIHRLIKRIEHDLARDTGIIPWSSPIPSFGDLAISKIATLGLNPSNREFVDERGHELEGNLRRFHTLKSLCLEEWSKAKSRHVRLVAHSCRHYFKTNPYDTWFKKLDNLISGTSHSYYSQDRHACHLDLIPYATAQKWTGLTMRQRATLLQLSGDTLSLMLRDSPIEVLILNGNSVVSGFERLCASKLSKKQMPGWNLPRQISADVPGFAYEGRMRKIGDVDLGREILVIGYNHNIQSSFGVTSAVIAEMRKWIGTRARGYSDERKKQRLRTEPHSTLELV